MADVFVARQPIFDRKLNVVGYELLFRGAATQQALVISPDGATASVVLNSFTEIGLERIVGSRPAWVNVSREFVLSGLAETVPAGLIMLEILENQVIDEQLIGTLRELKRRGYQLALDDFEYSPEAEPLLELVDVVKLDLLALGRENFTRHVGRLRPRGIALVAEKLETRGDYAYCANAGCDLFQGFFFCEPELLSDLGISANRASLLRVVGALQDPSVDFPQLERLIGRDVALSFRLLRYINSAFFGLLCEVRSIGQALALLGVENLKRWATLSVLISIDNKPPELTLTALIRARFCELAGQRLALASPGELFTLGLFSVIDALMDSTMEKVLASIPFPPDMSEALIAHAGDKGRLLDCVAALERGDFDLAQSILHGSGELYLDSLTWADAAADSLFDQPRAAAA
ncbi:MAG TPA: HDOD domain-containing protein [Solirubrobacteraceae bacterium]|nr:HDOD domain-containing protein [Solirubrobacteraceae bacterium]